MEKKNKGRRVYTQEFKAGDRAQGPFSGAQRALSGASEMKVKPVTAFAGAESTTRREQNRRRHV
jgi:hypothetical protein